MRRNETQSRGKLWTRRSAATLIAGAASSIFAPRLSLAADKTVYLLTWGGTIQAMLERDGWSKKFTDATGYEVVLVPKATGVEIMATAVAQKSKPQVDVVQSDLLPWLGGIEQGLYAPIDKDAAPNVAKLYDAGVIKDPESGQVIGVEPYGDIFALIYNKDVFARRNWAPPTQWTDLERPELQGQLLIPPATSVYALYTLIILARAHGGSEKNIEPGFEVMKRIGPGVVDWSDTFAKMSQFLADETASLAIHGIAGALDMVSRKLPVAYVVRTESGRRPCLRELVDQRRGAILPRRDLRADRHEPRGQAVGRGGGEATEQGPAREARRDRLRDRAEEPPGLVGPVAAGSAEIGRSRRRRRFHEAALCRSSSSAWRRVSAASTPSTV
jgi:putative spermidine/putrescine transport system substrate-binding protein